MSASKSTLNNVYVIICYYMLLYIYLRYYYIFIYTIFRINSINKYIITMLTLRVLGIS